MDCTASMGPWIANAKTRMVELTNQVQVEHPDANILTAFVGYRDYGDREPLMTVPFQPTHVTMEQIQQVEAEGGDDIAEDVAHGLEAALHQDWSDAEVKIVFHIADAPAHGMAFHTLHISDRFPRGDPDGFDPRDFVERMSFLDIHFTFVKIHNSTDTMIEVLHNCYTQGGTFSVIDLRRQGVPLGDVTLVNDELTRSISETITHYTSSQAL